MKNVSLLLKRSNSLSRCDEVEQLILSQKSYGSRLSAVLAAVLTKKILSSFRLPPEFGIFSYSRSSDCGIMSRGNGDSLQSALNLTYWIHLSSPFTRATRFQRRYISLDISFSLLSSTQIQLNSNRKQSGKSSKLCEASLSEGRTTIR